MKKRKKTMFIVIPVILLLIICYGFLSLHLSTNGLAVREFEIDLDTGGEEVRAVVISDLHDHEFGEKNEKLVQKIKEQNPDLILMDGDMLNRGSEDASVPLELITALADTAPIYYAMGNHEFGYIGNGHPELTRELESAGAAVLEERYVDLEVNGVSIRLGGMYDYAFGTNGDNEASAAPVYIREFLEDYQNTDRLKIMLSHRPDSFIFGDASEVWDVDLVISGHNHGGQVVIPFIGGLYGGDQGWFPEYIHGLYEKGRIQMFVTSGLGSDEQKLPRFNNLPEIAVLLIR